MTAQQGQENETTAPDNGVEDPTATSAGHAFWRRAGRHADVASEPADGETDPADAEAEPAGDVAEADDDVVVAEGVIVAEPADVAADPADDEAEADDDLAEADDDDIVAAEDVTVAEPADAAAEPGDDEAEADDDLAEHDEEVIVTEPDDVVVAEVIDEEPAQPSAAADPTNPAGEPSAGTSQPTADVTGLGPAGQATGNGLSQEWRDIQATFVDDPRGAVRLAAAATDAALNGLISSLRSRQEALSAATGDTAEHRDTEQLRGELREYRVLCQNLAEIEQRLTRPQAA
jgi:hypothetical protein